ncbi:hypothetical protein LOTGIDRAFT_167237 [Lottia gigantea]|uniref:Uncharacterized protein n=1 Tax=Lottia gigantea TaxID=225164 RepID=V3Z6M1_LOTGI|nr:hypothetical protein LOTGIDRAFT_167237 [Lottia gigantea]ESO86423.1 hypothetical protein LOTGIDRAFT_167237 [Lottia gigantea]
MSGVYNSTHDSPWNYSLNDQETRSAGKQWQNSFGEGLSTSNGVFRRDESNSTPTEIQLRETKSKSKLLKEDDDIPEWTNTFFGATFRRYSEEWKQELFNLRGYISPLSHVRMNKRRRVQLQLDKAEQTSHKPLCLGPLAV